MNTDVIKKNYLDKYKTSGQDKFYKFLLFYSVSRMMLLEKGDQSIMPPNLELLEYYNQSIIWYRREGEEIYLDMAKVFRRAAHKIYRVMLKKNLTNKNDKFLNLI